MKYQPYKSFGYPVLTPCLPERYADADYVNHNFEPSISPLIPPDEPNSILVQIEPYGIPVGMTRHIIEDDAELILLVSCRATFFTKCYKISNVNGGDIKIDNANLFSDEIEFSIFIRATKDFLLSDADINPEFGYKEFHVQKGMLLAQSAITPIYIQKEFYKNPKSIVSINTDKALKDGEYTVSLENDYIEIFVSPKLNTKINALKNSQGAKNYANNALYVPVITHALKELDQNSELMGYKWAQVLTQQLETIQRNHEIRSEAFNQAQALFKFPLSQIAVGD